MNIRFFGCALLCAALLTACSSSPVVGTEDSQFFSVQPGSTFRLNREITIQPDQTSVYLQNGNIEPVANVDFYKPHCKFELLTIADQARTVVPDTFVVTRIVDESEDVSTQTPRYASLHLASGGGVDGPIHLTFSTTMYLESNRQPDVFRMNCKQWDWPPTGDFVSINEMRQALGDYFTLILAK